MPVIQQEVTLRREELYQRVWKTAARTLAKELGISDVMLGKICRKHNVPKPPLGYWAKLQHGKADPRPPLPECHDDKLQMIPISPRHDRKEREPAVGAHDNDGDDQQAQVVPKIEVAAALRSPHPIVARTKSALERRSKEKSWNKNELYGPGVSEHEWYLPVCVGKTSIDRAMRIMDALVKACESVGHTFSFVREQYKRTMYLNVAGEKFQIHLREKTKRSDHILTADETATKKKYGWSSAPKYDYAPCGVFELKLLNEGGWSELRVWRDGQRRGNLEDVLGDFLAALPQEAEASRVRREAVRLEGLRRAEAEKRRYEDERRRKEEEERVQWLVRQAAAWGQANQIRAFADAVERNAVAKQGHIPSELAQWLMWARETASKVDPIGS